MAVRKICGVNPLVFNQVISAFVCNFSISIHLHGMNFLQGFVLRFLSHSFERQHSRQLTSAELNFYFGLINSLPFVVTLFSSPLTRWLADKYGRKSIYFGGTSIVSVLGGVLQTIATHPSVDSYQLFIVSRIPAGLVWSFSINIAPIYVSEMSPPSQRGYSNAIRSIFEELWRVASIILALPDLFGRENIWYWYFLLTLVPGAVGIACWFLFHESPKYLLLKNKNKQEAKRVTRRYYGSVEAEAALEHFLLEHDPDNGESSYLQILRDPYLRMMTFTASLLVCFVVTAGNTLMAFFSVSIMREQLGVSQVVAQYVSIAAGMGNVFCSIIQTRLVEKVGRRRLFLSVASVTIFTMCAFVTVAVTHRSLFPDAKWMSYLGAVLVMLPQMCTCLGINATVYLYSTEVVPHFARAQVMTLSVGFAVALRIIYNLFFPVMQLLMSEYSLIVFCVIPSLFILFCTSILMVETAGLRTDQLIIRRHRQQT